MAIYEINESDTRFNPNASIIPRRELTKLNPEEKLQLRRKDPRTDVPSNATEFIGNNQGPEGSNPGEYAGADVDIYGVRLRKGDQLTVDINDIGGDGLDHLVRLFRGGGEIEDWKSDTFTFTASKTGKYFLAVSASGNGSYDPDNIKYGSRGNGNRVIPGGNDTGAFEIELSLIPRPIEKPEFTVSDVTLLEGTLPGQNQAVFTVLLDRPENRPKSAENVVIQTVDGTATAGEDYTPLAPTIYRFGRNETEKRISIDIAPDALAELHEAFYLEIAPDPNGQAVAIDPRGEAKLINDDFPGFIVSDVTLEEGTLPGQNEAVFTVSLSSQSAESETVFVKTADGTAIAGEDYTPLGRTPITFAPFDTTPQEVRIPIAPDSLAERHETFFLELEASEPVLDPRNQDPNGRIIIPNPRGTAKIINDDFPAFLVSDVTIEEGTSPDQHFAVFTVSLSSQSAVPETVIVQTADGTAIAGEDYTPLGPTEITFAPFETTSPDGTISIPITPDSFVERDETFFLELEAKEPVLEPIDRDPNGRIRTPFKGTATIVNDDIPKVSLGITEPFVENGGTATITATLDRIHPFEDVTVNVAFSGEAILGTDYSASSQSIIIRAGQTTGSLELTGIDDAIVETHEPIIVDIESVTNAEKVGGPVETKIIDDDKALLSISDVEMLEGNEGTTPFNFTVTTDAISSRDILVTVETGDISATEGEDYIGLPPTQVIIPAGEFSAPVPSIEFIGDTIAEEDEQFGVILTDPKIEDIPEGVMIGDRLGVGTILNDDLPNITLSVDVDTIVENGGQATITASLDIPALSIFNGVPIDGVMVELDFGGEATLDEDYSTTNPPTITIPRGETMGETTIEITAIDDFIDEMDGEAIEIGIKSLINANELEDQTLSVFITDDDTAGITVVESNGNTAVTEGGNNDTYTIVLDSQPTDDVTITLAPDNQLTLDQDTITFTSDNWNQPQTVTVTAVDDTVLEGDHSGLITHTVSSADAKYDGMSIADVNVAIEDVYNVMFVSSGREGQEPRIDKRLIAELEGEGGGTELAKSDVVKVETIEDDGVQGLTLDFINRHDLIIISESVNSKNVGNTLSNARGGVMTWESHLFDDLGMTGPVGDFDEMHPGQDVNYGFVRNAKQIEITEPDHPLAAGLSGTVDVYHSNSRISWGLVNGNATVVATLSDASKEQLSSEVDQESVATIFAYGTGAMMAGGIEATGKRLGFFLHNHGDDPSNLHPNAITLFNAAVDYMVG